MLDLSAFCFLLDLQFLIFSDFGAPDDAICVTPISIVIDSWIPVCVLFSLPRCWLLFPSPPARHIFSHELVNILIGTTGIWNFTTIITILVIDTVHGV